MNLNPTSAQLGWKTNDEPKHAPAHQLSTPADIDNAFKTLMKMKSSTRHQKEVVMVIVHLVHWPSHPKHNSNWFFHSRILHPLKLWRRRSMAIASWILLTALSYTLCRRSSDVLCMLDPTDGATLALITQLTTFHLAMRRLVYGPKRLYMHTSSPMAYPHSSFPAWQQCWPRLYHPTTLPEAQWSMPMSKSCPKA